MPTFLHPTLLWGLALAGVPVLIHLINMMRRRRVRWAAMEFLLASQKKHRTWVLLKELLLLAMRMLAVALVVLLAATPLVRDTLGTMLGGRKTHHVVLLDDSYSMSEGFGGATVMDRAKRVVGRIGAAAAQRPEPQTFTLLRFSRAGRPGRPTQPDVLQNQVDREFAESLEAVLKTMGPSQSAVGPAGALATIGQLLGESSDETRIVYLVSDFRKKEWDQPGDLRTQLAGLASKGTELHLIDCAEGARANLAISRFEPASGTRAAGVPLFMEVEVRNFGATPARGVPVMVEEDGHGRPAVKIKEIAPRSVVRERFETRFATAGQHRLAARLDSDAVALDNVRYAAVDVPPEVPVLVVDGSADARGAFFLGSALAPGGTVRTGIAPRVETPRFLDAGDLDRWQVIYLTDVAALDRPVVEALERYVADGGGLAMFVGPRCRADSFNGVFWRGGKGVLPAPLDRQNELPIDRLDKTPDVEVTAHPVFRVFAGRDNDFLATVNVNRYFSVPDDWRPAADSTVSVIARLRTGEPLVVERAFGKGRVIEWLTTATPTWNSAGANPSFPVLIQEMQAYLAGRPRDEARRLVGKPLELTFDQTRYQARARLLTPGESGPEATVADAAKAGKGMLAVRFARTDLAGFYEGQLTTSEGTVEPRVLAVNVDTWEGDLAKLDGPQRAARLRGVVYTFHQADAFETVVHESPGQNLSDGLLYLLVALLIGEQLMAWTCSYHPPKTVREALPSRGAAA